MESEKIQKPERRQITFYSDPSVIAAIRAEAKKYNISLSDLINLRLKGIKLMEASPAAAA